MLSKQEIKEKVIESISEVLNQELPRDLPLSTNIYSDLRMDSMDLASLIALMEDDHDIQFDEKRFDTVATIEQLVSLLHELTQE